MADFELFLKTTRENNHNRALKRIKHLKTIINMAMAKGWIERYPFYGYKAKFNPAKIVYLTGDELASIENKKFAIDRLERVKGVFLFQCYTGLAYIDVLRLNGSHIVSLKGKGRWIQLDWGKTDAPAMIPIIDKAADLLKIYPDGFPVPSNQKMNAYLKEIEGMVGISKNLTSHVARRTFAMAMLNAGVSVESVAAMLGHRAIRVTQKHYAKVLPEKIFREVKRRNK